MGADTKARQPNQKFNIPPLASAYGGVLPMTKITGDGRCLFRSVAYGACLRRGKQAPSDSAQKKLADELRAKVADEFVKRRGDTEWFLEGNFDNYVKQMRNPQAWGGEPELFMCSHVLRMPITVYMYTSSDDGPRIIAEYGQEYGKDDPVCVLYDGYGHYDALQPSVVLDLPQSNLWNYTGGMVGSFSELMSAASAGMMNFDGIQDCGGNQNGYKNEPFSTEIPIEDYCNGVEGAIEDYSHGDEYVVQELGISDDSEDAELEVGFEDDSEDVSEGAEVEVADYHNGAEDESSEDQGYLGGEDRHVDDDSSDDEEYLDPKQCEDRIDDSKVCIDELTGCDSSDHEEPRDGQIQKDRTANLGDCGCVTGEDQDVFSDSVEEILSDSSDSEDEQEVTIEVDLAQEFYVDKLQEGVPYKKRKRVHKGSKRPNCRKPRAMGAIERAMRSASTRDTEHIFEPKLGLVFDSRQEAREFYNMYSWEVGFGVKYNSSRPTGRKSEKKRDEEDEEEYISMQEIVCQRSGSDSRITTGTKRCGCPAKIRLHRTDDYGWYISTFVKDHNHEYSKTMGDQREWNSHWEIEPNMKEMIKNLRRNNVSLTKVHCILGDMYGSMGDVPWTKRSLRTICNQIAKDQMNDDIRKTMEIFRDMHEADPGFQFSAELDKQSRIRTLLWCSGRSREQYACFGDVVTFDTTYCTNIYKMPFGLFVGVNHHFQTTIFAGVFMRRETAKSFKWVFREFLKLMGGKAPQTILTDQCKAMAKALRFVMPDTYHLWCKWHVMKKIKESLGPLYTKNKKFRDEFWLVVNGMLTEDEFEAAWADLVKRYRLEANGFMNRIYKCKKRWAKPWSKDKFCARMSSTQRSESANHMLKRFVPRNSSMNHFVSQYTRMLYDREREEDIAEHKTKQLKMVHSRLWAIERHALSIYTKAAFELFRTEVDKASNYVQSAEEGNTYTISHDNPTVREKWARVHFKVQEIDGGKRYVCECGLYEHFGILCCHTIRLLLQKHIGQIPDAHIMKRWTRDARDVLPPELKMYQKDQTSMQSNTFRHRLLNLQSVKLQAKGDTDIELFDIVMKHMRAAEKEADEVIAKRKKNAEDAPVEESTDEDSVEKETEDVGVQSDGGVLRSKAASVHSGGLLQKKHGCSSKKGPVLVRNNRYGASGSSAHYSDSEIIGMKAPYLKRKEGRPRNNRFYAGSEYKKKKLQKKESKKKDVREHASGEMGVDLEGQHDNGNGREGGKVTPKGSKREIKCGKCSMKGHNATQCCTLPINDATAALYF